jgi:hypothetical protein
LRGPEVLIMAPILGVLGMVLVQLSHLIAIAMSSELAPASAAHGTDQATLATLSDTLASASVRINTAGDLLVWGSPSRCTPGRS